MTSRMRRRSATSCSSVGASAALAVSRSCSSSFRARSSTARQPMRSTALSATTIKCWCSFNRELIETAGRRRFCPRSKAGRMAILLPSSAQRRSLRLQLRARFANLRWSGRQAPLMRMTCSAAPNMPQMRRPNDPAAQPPHRGISILLVEHGPGLGVSRDLPKLGYKGVESCELAFDNCRVPATSLLGGEEGHGFAQMMRGLEIGRIQVAARAIGVGRAAFEDAVGYPQERGAFGKPIWKHQSVGNLLADMATRLTAARQLLQLAAERYESGERSDLEAGMAKLFASEMAMSNALDALRIHGGNGYSTEYDIERYFRDAPLMIVGEGTNELQRNVIVQQLVERGGADSRDVRRWHYETRSKSWLRIPPSPKWLSGRRGREGLHLIREIGRAHV